MKKMMPRKILLIQLFSYGDCLFATAIARQIKSDFPGCELTWAIAPFCSSILDNNPYVDIVWEPDYITDKSLHTFSTNKKRLFRDADARGFDTVFFSQIIEDNFSYYNGLVRSSLFAAFGRKITVPVQPILEVTDNEKKRVEDFVFDNQLTDASFLILFECAPLSGQLKMTIDKAYALSSQVIIMNPGARVILSSQDNKDIKNPAIINGAGLSLRETAYLTSYCDLLIGCSSGITWASTSSAAKPIPSVQLLDKDAYIFNSPVLDHERFGLSTERWLELYDFNDALFLDCIHMVIETGFEQAKIKFGQRSGMTFKLYRGIVHYFLKNGRFKRLSHFLKDNFLMYKFNPAMIKSILLGFLLFPIQVVAEYFKTKNRK